MPRGTWPSDAQGSSSTPISPIRPEDGSSTNCEVQKDLRNSHGSTGSSTSNQDCGYYQRAKSRRHSASMIRAELLKTKPENKVCISIPQQGVAGCFLQARCLLIRLADLLPAHWTIYLQFPRTLCIFSLSIALRTELSYCICTHLRFQPTSSLPGAFTQIQFNLFHRP